MTKIKLFDSFDIDTELTPIEIVKSIPKDFEVDGSYGKTISIRQKQKHNNIDYFYMLYFFEKKINTQLEEIVKFNTNIGVWYIDDRPTTINIWTRRAKTQ